MRTTIMIGLLVGLLGCGDNDAAPAATCSVPSTSVIGFVDCHVMTADGDACIASCGQLPDDGSMGSLLPAGCQVDIGASFPRTGTCVDSCSDCAGH